MSKIKVGIIDDHQAIAQGLSSVLNTDHDVVFIVSEKKDILKTLQNGLPDVLVMDVVMPGTSGIEAFKDVLTAFPDLKIIAYTALNSPMMIEFLLRAGVRGYFGKNQALSELKDAISDVYYGRFSVPEDYKFLLKKMRSAEGPEELSKREIEVLSLIAREKKTHEIAELLDISVNTVETHRKHLFDKLQVSNLAGLIKAGFEQGYIK